jgi:hypothetical protein
MTLGMRWRRGAWGVLAGAIALALATPGLAARDVRRIQAVGAYPVGLAHPLPLPPQDGAVEAAVADAVHRVGLALLPEDGQPVADRTSGEPPADAEALVAGALGQDVFAYATRYRILEDRGVRPAMLSGHPDAKREYVVVVEVFVDAGRVADQLRAAGLLEAPAGDDRVQVRLVAEGIRSYAAYAALRETLLGDLGVRSALPIELERGRAVLAIDGERAPEALLDDLVRGAPPGLRVVPLEAGGDTLSVLVEFGAPPAEAGAGDAGDAIDMDR